MSTKTVWRKIRVSIDFGEQPLVYDAEWDGETWNGFACPRFTREITEQIVADAERINAKLIEDGWHPFDVTHMEWDGDVLVTTDHGEPGDDYVERYEPDGAGMYHVGSHSWVWVEVEGA